MKILIVGGTGFIGKELIRDLQQKGHQIVLLSRNKAVAKKTVNDNVDIVEWDNSLIILPSSEIEDIDVVINLAGESIGSGRWTKKKKERIINSRIVTTRAIVEAINDKVFKPKILINASAIGFYGPSGDNKVTENQPAGEDFLANVSKVWEIEANKAEIYDTKVVTLRIGLVLGEGGALKQMITPYKFYLGGAIGNGEQWVSWIHMKDLVGIIHFIITYQIEGAINCTSPNPIRMKEFSKSLGKVLTKPSWFNIPERMLRLALGEMSDMLLNSQRVIPERIQEVGYKFKLPKIDKALEDIFNKK